MQFLDAGKEDGEIFIFCLFRFSKYNELPANGYLYLAGSKESLSSIQPAD